jgi:AbrB family looped-hinge helix DNA binding protein
MSRVTSKLQVTLPKAIATQYNIRPGDEVQFTAAGDVVRLEPRTAKQAPDTKTRLDLFDQATERQRRRETRVLVPVAADRGWKREDLYDRDRSR